MLKPVVNWHGIFGVIHVPVLNPYSATAACIKIHAAVFVFISFSFRVQFFFTVFFTIPAFFFGATFLPPVSSLQISFSPLPFHL
jgi:hypothetical protein